MKTKKKTPSKVEIEDKLFKLLTSIYKNKQKKNISNITMVKDGFNKKANKRLKNFTKEDVKMATKHI